LRNLADKYGIKDTKSIEDFIRIKIYLIISFFTQQKNFLYDESNKKGLNNILEIINKFSEKDSNSKLNHLLALYGILPTNSYFKKDTLIGILNHLHAVNDLTTLIKSQSEKLNEVIEDFFNKNFGKEDELSTLQLLSEIIKKLGNYEILLNKSSLNQKIKSLLLGGQITSLALYKLLFFHIYSSFSLEFFASSKNINFSDAPEEEKKFIASLENKNLGEFNSLNQSYFREAYGDSAGERILKNGKLWIIFSSLQKLDNKSSVSFEKIEKELNINLEDLEDVLFDGFSTDLFKLTLDYESNQVKIAYVKKLNYDQEYVNTIKTRVSALREKIAGFTKKIDLLIMNE
jgi:hypothetical protein